MLNDSDLLKLIVELASEIEHGDPIDWGMLAIDEKNAYEMLGASVIENLRETDRHVLLAIIVKLTVENFVLNLKYLTKENNE